MKEKTLMYDYIIKHVPGTWHLGPDACSRYPSKQSSDFSSVLSDLRHPAAPYDISESLEINCYVQSSVLAAMSGGGYTDGIDVDVITSEHVQLPTMKKLLPFSYQSYLAFLRQKKSYQYLFSHTGTFMMNCPVCGVALYTNRIIVPKSLRGEVPDCLHSAHLLLA